MLSILQAKLQQHHELPDVQAGLRKSRQTRDQIANICWIIQKARKFLKKIYWEDPEGLDGRGVRSGDQDGEHM